MTDIDYRLTNQIDPLKSLREDESKQIKGFEATGAKHFTYLGDNQVLIRELPSGVEYMMEFLLVKRILEVSGFDEKKLELSFGKLLSRQEVYYRFDKKIIYMKGEQGTPNPILESFSDAIDNYDPEIGTNPNDLNFDDSVDLFNKY